MGGCVCVRVLNWVKTIMQLSFLFYFLQVRKAENTVNECSNEVQSAFMGFIWILSIFFGYFNGIHSSRVLLTRFCHRSITRIVLSQSCLCLQSQLMSIELYFKWFESCCKFNSSFIIRFTNNYDILIWTKYLALNDHTYLLFICIKWYIHVKSSSAESVLM